MGLIGPDEPRYAWIARAMAQTHDWVTPRLYGQPWFEKPILYYWLAAIGFLLHLPAEWAARLPSAFAMLIAAISLGCLGGRHYERSRAFWSPSILAPLLFSTTAAAVGFARAGSPDAIFCGALTITMAAAALILSKQGALSSPESDASAQSGNRDTLDLIFLGFALGLATLAKGPAAIILTGGAVGLWAICTTRWRAAFRLLHPLGIATFLLVALPWYVICALRNDDFLRVFILQHNFGRYLTNEFQHRQPIWFFFPVTLVALLPWTAALWLVARKAAGTWREKLRSDSPSLFFSCWAIFPIAFFSFSQSKLPGYILPAIPPLSLLCAVAISRAARTGNSACSGIARWLGLTLVILGVAALAIAARPPAALGGAPHVRAAALSFGFVALLLGILFAGPIGSRRKHLAVPLTLLFVASAVEFLNFAVLPSLDWLYSARPYAELLHNDLRKDRLFVHQLPRSWDFGLAFYFSRELPEWSPADPEPALVLTQQRQIPALRKMGRIQGDVEEPYGGIELVPIAPAPR
jgi:4-amino-4-deoxy-L-arabinose transferase-like glycosyltransferase